MIERRGFLRAMLALAAAPAVAGFLPTPAARAIASTRYVNVLDYGADPLGKQDATAAFQRAMNAVMSGGTVFVPPGSYSVSPDLFNA